MSAALTERLVAIAQARRMASHGAKGAIMEAACRELGISRTTLLKKMKEVSVTVPRKRRSDAGQTALTREEAQLISAVLMESHRKNEKRLYSVGRAVKMLRANGLVRAEFIDPATGEIRPLSESTIHRALRAYGLHPDQLMQPAPAIELASLHPNHCWQIDASLCVLYYLRRSADPRENGLRVMEHDQFYKNKPKNVDRIVNDRVWRYAVADHASSAFYLEYVMGAETGENLTSAFINAMQMRHPADPMHGVPRMVMLDPGSANTGAVFMNLCRGLRVHVQINKPGNPRAKGTVEKAHDLIERYFESGLKLRPVHSLAELNETAWRWMRVFNGTQTHSRHGMTRYDAWQRITPEQLLKAPPVEVCRELAISAPEYRKVSVKLTVAFRGQEYDVSSVPNVMVGEKVLMARNPWREDAAQVVLIGEDGHEVFHVVEAVERNEFGFRTDAAVVGESYKRHADTPAQTAMKAIEQLVTGTDNQADAAAARKAKALPFGGRIDPYKHIEEAPLPTYLPRRGTELDIASPRVEFRPLSSVEAARLLKDRLEAAGSEWKPAYYAWLSQRFPEGVPQDQLDAIAAELSGPRAGLSKPLTLVRAAAGGE